MFFSHVSWFYHKYIYFIHQLQSIKINYIYTKIDLFKLNFVCDISRYELKLWCNTEKVNHRLELLLCFYRNERAQRVSDDVASRYEGEDNYKNGD